ncbi:MAG: hypothetical protein H7Y38_06745 [Armatimonadetes bacterium]|nr:hypothetical protein [Armatimonadota bacterium]
MIRYARPFLPLSRFFSALPAALRWGVAALLFVGMAWLYRHHSLSFSTNSDYANSLLQGDAIAHGNPLLNHWVMTTVSYYTTDALLYGIGVLIRGFDTVLLHEIPVVVYLGVLVSAMLLATNAARRGAKRNVWGAVVVFASIGLPLGGLGVNFMIGPARTCTILYMLLMLLLLDTPRVSVPRLLLFGTLLTFTLLGDDFPRYVIVVPILLLAALRVWRDRAAWKTEVPLVCVAIGAVVAAKVVYALMKLVGTYVITDSFSSQVAVIPINDVPIHFLRTIESLQVLYYANFWGETIRAGLGARVMICILPVSFCFASWYVLARLAKAARQPVQAIPFDRVSAYLAIGMAINLLAYTFTNLTTNLGAVRYLVPFCVFGAVLLGRGVSRGVFVRRRTRVLALYASLVGALFTLPYFLIAVRQPSYDPPARRMGEWLVANGLREGYGSYWGCAEVTARSGNRAHIRPIAWDGANFHTFFWGVDSRWFAPSVQPNFVLIDPEGFGTPPASVIKQFGIPSRTEQQFGYTVLIYDRDISGKLIVDKLAP